MRIGIFEDNGYSNLQPLTYIRPVFDLRCGMYLLREKIEKKMADYTIDYFVRNSLQDLMVEKYPDKKINQFTDDDYLFLNGRVVFNSNFLTDFNTPLKSTVYNIEDSIAAAFIKQADLNQLTKDQNGILNFDSFSEKHDLTGQAKPLKYSWDFVHENSDEISKDFYLTTKNAQKKNQSRDGVYIMNSENVYIADSSRIDPGVVIIAEEGPVYIDEDAHLFPQATIIGPAYVGRKSLIKIGAKIYEGTSIGEVCKIGGEVEESIIHSYSNKQHDGFLGHAYLGQWVNLGADTNNSDLKNNYGSVRVYVNGKEVDSGSTFVGLTMGDHSKSGINTMFNTGTTVGIMCNVYGSDFPPKWIPSFSWGGSAGFVEHQIEKAISLAKKVMARRKMEMGRAEEKLIRSLFEQMQKK
jgi:UDP-N-acetylglucosamine diphosphorylase/glucosamine-1-phosphate N-acetyltransferase